MTDKREAILQRLEAVLGGLVNGTGGEAAWRNLVEIPDEPRPAIILLDGDEDNGGQSQRAGRPATVPSIVVMTPEIFVLDKERVDAEVGSALNALRAQIIHAVLTDAALTALCHDSKMSYDGMATGLASGRSLLGEAAMLFSFAYVLRPDVVVG